MTDLKDILIDRTTNGRTFLLERWRKRGALVLSYFEEGKGKPHSFTVHKDDVQHLRDALFFECLDRPFPHPVELGIARKWLRVGAPAASKHFDAKVVVRVLINLIEALPYYLSLYAYGSEANTREYRERDDRAREEREELEAIKKMHEYLKSLPDPATMIEEMKRLLEKYEPPTAEFFAKLEGGCAPLAGSARHFSKRRKPKK